ncbi:PVC-type heme-binding CxxCH protein [Planctomyces sp. SH-PL62]|uniref:PVC-type heme-binding CxxCH protein n=1 Tax=Planctomyces sp. SH-PL62 TaxID=1636152 RepID=UPI00078DFF17|nr:PVC-type heme-binding CxxCH protein [Planctomyces sp. SH-PL62]AMV37203.1 Cytochrome c [Planctomyces sp. SH-PL62]
MNRSLKAGLALLTLAILGADDPLPRLAPQEPAEAAKSFRMQAGFRLDLLAAEPLVMDPVAAAYDENGRLYVVEMTDYPHVDAAKDRPFADNQDPPVGRVRILIDDDGDGVFDRSEIFADKLSWPTGVAVWKGGVFVAATPDVWYLKDHDGDLKADERRQVLTGFRKYNVQAVMNNLQWGLDHKVYGAGSSNGGKIRPTDAPEQAGVDVARRDFRFDPGSGRVEVVSGGARFGNTFDDWGDRFLCDIRNPAEHVVLPSRYLARNLFLPTPKVLHDAAEAGDAIPMYRVSPPEPWRELRARRWTEVGKALPRSELVAGGSLTSSSGLTVYRGDAYPDSYRGQLFLGEVANNLVHRMRVEPDGVTFRATRADDRVEFVASTDTWFRPVNFVNAPDGTLHVLDMYRETIEHPWSIPEDILARLDLRSGEDRGRIYRLAPPDFVHRRAPLLGDADVETLVKLLEHPNGWHRDTAHRLLFERQDAAAVPFLKALLRDSREAVGRLHALYSLEGLAALSDADLLLTLGDVSPHLREHAVRLAEPRLGSPELREAVLRLAEDPEPRVRFQVAFTLGEIPGEAAAPALAAIARRDAADPWIRTAVLSSATVDPAGLFERLQGDGGFAAAGDGASLLRSLALVVGARGKDDEIGRVLAALSRGGRDDAASDAALGLGDGLARNRRRLSGLVGLPPESTAWLDALFATAASTAPDESATPAARVRAAAILGQMDYDQAAAVLAPLLGPDQPPALQSAAVKALAGFDRPEVAGILLGPWKGYTPGLRTEVAARLLGRRAWLGPLLDAVEAGTVAVGQIPPTRRTLLVADNDPAVRARAQALFAAEAVGPRAEAVARFKPILETPGDPDRGRAVFDRECMVCHKLGERGHAVGPNLAGVRRRTAEEILVNILDPNREVSPEFLEYTVALDDGRVASGLVASETPSGVTLRGREGVEETILRRNLAEIAGTGKSLMPEGLETSITPPEMADLIAFLLRIQD